MAIVVRKRSGRLPGGIYTHTYALHGAVCVYVCVQYSASDKRWQRFQRGDTRVTFAVFIGRFLRDRYCTHAAAATTAKVNDDDDDDAARTDLNRKFPCAGSHRSPHRQPSWCSGSPTLPSAVQCVRARHVRICIYVREREMHKRRIDPVNSDHVRLMRPLISPITRGVNNILFFPIYTYRRTEKKLHFHSGRISRSDRIPFTGFYFIFLRFIVFLYTFIIIYYVFLFCFLSQ